MIRIPLLLIFILGLASHAARAAACCGGGASFPSLILSDDRAQVGFSYSFAKIIGDAPAMGKAVFRSSQDDEHIQTYSLDAAYVFADRWQVGMSVPVLHKARATPANSSSSTGLGDIFATLGFEILPEYTYSQFKPRGFLYLQLLAPTGGNMFEAKKAYAVDSRGKGFLTPVVGSFFTKTWSSWDASLRLAVGQSFSRSFKGAVFVRPGTEVNGAVGVGYSPHQGNWRWGLTLNPAYEAPNNIATYKLVWNSSLDVAYLWQKQWLFQLAYSDQTLVGPAKNMALSRGLQLALRYKWPQ